MTTYLGEHHPATKKVVCEFCTADLAVSADLTEPQRIKLIKLAGVRYNPDTDIVKMSSEMHDTPMQNKRYLSDLVQKLLQEAKDPSDMFEDIPLDFRHHRPKKTFSFPQEWKLDSTKRRQLIAERQKVAEIEGPKREREMLIAEQEKDLNSLVGLDDGQMGERFVDGGKILERAIAAMPKEVPRIVSAPQRKRLR